MSPARTALVVGFSAFAIFIASPVSAQSIDLLRYGAGLGPYESDGYDEETVAPAPRVERRVAPQRTTRTRKGAACSKKHWDTLKGWVNVATPCR